MSSYQYQTFDDAAGMVDSYDKLLRVKLPVVHGLKVLDIGCNEGFFCGAAKKAGAARVLGVDSFAEVIERAAHRFPDCEFQCRDWFDLPQERFDLVLYLASLHYLGDDERIRTMFVAIRDRLANDGVFVLETGVYKSEVDEFKVVLRDDGTTVHYPSFPKLHELAIQTGFGYRVVGVTAEADGVERYSIHLKKLARPLMLVRGRPASGKTRLAEGITRFENKFLVKTDSIAEEVARERGIDPERIALNLPMVYEENQSHFVDAVLYRTVGAVSAQLAMLLAEGYSSQVPLVIEGYLPDEVCMALQEIIKKSIGVDCWQVTTDKTHGSPWDLPGARVSIDGMLYLPTLTQSSVARVEVVDRTLRFHMEVSDQYGLPARRFHFLDAGNRTLIESLNTAQATAWEVVLDAPEATLRRIENVVAVHDDGGVSFVDFLRSEFAEALATVLARRAAQD